MNIASLIGKKIDQTQGFLEDGRRVPLSIITVDSNVVSQVKTAEKEGYNSVQIGFGKWNKPNKPMAGHSKKAGLTITPRFFREVRVDATPDINIGSALLVNEVFEPGDVVDVTGVSKGKGYAGVVKRHGFAGGPRTHGQSDRERAPGSSGQTTTPGRVYKGKRMAGRMGNEQVTIKNLEVLSVDGGTLLIRGLVPGTRGAIVVIKKVGKNKKFVPLFSDAAAEVVEVATAAEEVKTAEEEVVTPEEKIETASDAVETAEEAIKDSSESVVSPEENKEEEKIEEKVEATEEAKASPDAEAMEDKENGK